MLINNIPPGSEEEVLDLFSMDNGDFLTMQNNFFFDPKYKQKDLIPPYPSGRRKSVSFTARAAVYSVICMHAFGKKTNSYPGISTIAKEAGVNKQTTENAILDLVVLGLIVIRHRYNDGGKTSNRYFIINITGNSNPASP